MQLKSAVETCSKLNSHAKQDWKTPQLETYDVCVCRTNVVQQTHPKKRDMKWNQFSNGNGFPVVNLDSFSALYRQARVPSCFTFSFPRLRGSPRNRISVDSRLSKVVHLGAGPAFQTGKFVSQLSDLPNTRHGVAQHHFAD